MVELNIAREGEQADEPKQQENQQPRAGVSGSTQEAGDQRPKAAGTAEPKTPEDQGHKTGAAADAAATIRDAEPRLMRKLIDMGLKGDSHALTYVLDHIQHVDEIKLDNIQCVEDGVENLRKLVNAYNAGKIGVTASLREPLPSMPKWASPPSSRKWTTTNEC